LGGQTFCIVSVVCIVYAQNINPGAISRDR